VPLVTPNLLSWQLERYPDNHRTRANLVVHIVTAPLFALAMVAIPVSAWLGAYPVLGASVAIQVLTLVLQGRGHAGEQKPPIPFLSPVDFVARFVAEQTVTFPRFVFSGGFARAWSGSRRLSS
jgi:hypothetical protein